MKKVKEIKSQSGKITEEKKKINIPFEDAMRKAFPTPLPKKGKSKK
jgi:hypothetical protein